MQIAYPFHLDPDGLAASADQDAHIRDLIEQVLFTSPGERVNRPDFGCGLEQLVFAQIGTERATAIQGLVQGALQQWLRDLIQVERVSVAMDDATLQITIQYVVLQTQQRQVARFER